MTPEEIEELQAEIILLKQVLQRMLPIVNRLILDDSEEDTITMASMLVEYPTKDEQHINS